jgi:isochorismate hydrolase
MSRSRSRKAKRFRRLKDTLRDAVRRARTADKKAAEKPFVKPGDGELAKLLRNIHRSDVRVWYVARVIRCTEEERAMIAKIVAPHLAG